ncbi:WD40-repeat-containing domain protein [Crucibulum laeve]|uniref:WD40-repeat-containing domain protein n=1 Tax=Crucibulum laeve TaxID=68775 RepID=A0A5C3LGK1_9AGAR|nr:WD40-repeat-containing domain protein [Crucibulum laeve]
MVQARRRVSYVIPPPSEPVPRLQLPSHSATRLGATGPLLIPAETPGSFGTPEEQLEPAWVRHPRHRLGVSTLALDTSTLLQGHSEPKGLLYTAGRDGQIISWELCIPMKKRKVIRNGDETLRSGRWEVITGWANDSIDEETEDEERLVSDGDVLGEVTSNLSQRRQRAVSKAGEIPHEKQWETDLSTFTPGVQSQFRQCAQAHTDWVNDMLLCNLNQTVVSASSDGTVKAWSPHISTISEPTTIGTHSDYVRCLSHCREQNWVASGSFDRTIKLWDLTRSTSSGTVNPLMTLNPPDANSPKSSVYALAADPFGRTIASGSPEKVIRLWDPRSGRRTGKLVGHTDNIRAILISEDSKYLLTGSADASIKLWSLSSQRCLHTFTHHADSVWSLSSSHPSMEVFYSGDRSGLVCRTDVEDCSQISDGDCILLFQDVGEPERPASEGINKIVTMDDNLVWTASGTSSIRRWCIPQRRIVRAAGHAVLEWEADRPAVSDSPVSSFKKNNPFTQESPSEVSTRSSTSQGYLPRNSLAPSASVQSLSSDNRDPTLELDIQSLGIPLDSLIKLRSPDESFSPHSSSSVRARDPEVATMYSAASVMSVPTQLRPSVTAIFARDPQYPPPLRTSRTDDTVTTLPPALNSARADYEERELAVDAVPLSATPDSVIRGDHGVVRTIILNDRMHALTVDTSGQVAVWDIIHCVCRGRFLREDVADASQAGSTAGGSGGDKERSPREALEAVRERIEGEAVVLSWCTADTQGGVLSIHMNERCFDAEVYADEVGFANDRHYNDESKLNLGKWILRNLFMSFIKEELRFRRHHQQSSAASNPDGILPPSLGRSPPHSDPESPTHRRSSSSPESHRKSPRVVTSSIVMCSPRMVPVIPPPVYASSRASPLLAPLIPLYPQNTDNAVLLTSQPITMSGNDATPTPIPLRARSRTIDNVQTPLTSAPLTSKETPSTDYFSIRTRQPSIQGGSAVPSTTDDFSGWGGPGKEPQTPSTPSGLMGRLKNFSKIGSKKANDATSSPVIGIAAVPEAPLEVCRFSK